MPVTQSNLLVIVDAPAGPGLAPSACRRGYAFAGLQLLLTEAAKRGLE